jgi:glycosyltransferase involved in cell wall biosynthesis
LKLLIVTQYYPPETGAAQNRLHELARRLKDKGIEVCVLTAMPNYPQMKIYDGYRRKCRMKEAIDGVTVYRSWIFTGNSSSIFLRLLNYFSFVMTSFFSGWFRTGKCDLIMCESPPLFLGISACLLSKIKRAGFIFNVSDLWPESAEKLGLIRSKFLLGISRRLEECLYRNADLVSGQTRGIVKNISARFPGKHVYWLPNGANLSLYRPIAGDGQWRSRHGYHSDDFIIFYGGIIGHAQGLDVVLRAAARLRNNSRIKFVIMGSGPLKENLMKERDEAALEHIRFFDTVEKWQMPEILAAVDVSVIPLRRIALFRGAIPSKIFESLAMKKPILLGVEGEAKELFIDDGACGLAYEPENDLDLSEKILLLHGDRKMLHSLGENARRYVVSKFDRDSITDEFYEVLTSLKRGN